jgi:hypothetical protein
MKVLIGGVVAAVVGLALLVLWWFPFLMILKGGIPICLLLGGILAIYIGIDEMKDQMLDKRDNVTGMGQDEGTNNEELEETKKELERIKAEAAKYKEELEKVKEENAKKVKA